MFFDLIEDPHSLPLSPHPHPSLLLPTLIPFSIPGFDLLLSQLDDLRLDTPDAPEVLGNFMARCVADDCLPPAYVNNHSESTNPNMM